MKWPLPVRALVISLLAIGSWTVVWALVGAAVWIFAHMGLDTL